MYELRFSVLLRYRDELIQALLLALTITIASLAIGVIIGLFMAFLRTGNNATLRRIAGAYVQFFRNIPLLLIIVFIFFGLPLLGVRFLDKYASVILAMSLYAAAYLTEIFRAGIEATESRYVEASKSIGLTPVNTARYILMPLMFAEILPALSNMAISLFKDSSLAAAISIPEITFIGRKINTDTWRIIEAWTAVAIMYLGVSYFAAFALRRLETFVVRWR